MPGGMPSQTPKQPQYARRPTHRHTFTKFNMPPPPHTHLCEVLPEVVRRARLQRLAVEHHRLDSVRDVGACRRVNGARHVYSRGGVGCGMETGYGT
eukprot:100160-Chlamydomonas_euryale.AAC.4